jgi:hypothetical protein
MATNIIDTVRKNLGLPELQKIDPNFQETRKASAQSQADRLTQAALPAVMAGLYRMTRTEEGARELANNYVRHGNLSAIFRGHEQEVVRKVAAYAGVSEEAAITTMQGIADESVNVLNDAVGPDASFERMEHFMNGQRREILTHLPAALQMGETLGDETLDDRTQKMEGPVSSFVNRIGDTLSDGEQKQGEF